MFHSNYLSRVISVGSNCRLFLWAMNLLFLLFLANIASQPMAVYGQTIPQANFEQHLPFVQVIPATTSDTPVQPTAVLPTAAPPTAVPPTAVPPTPVPPTPVSPTPVPSSFPAVYHPDRAAYVTDLVELAPSEVKRWGRGRITEVAYSPSDDQLAVGTSLGVWIYQVDEPDNGRLLPHVGDISSMSWSSDGSQIGINSDDDIRIWDVATGEEVSDAEQWATLRNTTQSPDGSKDVTTSHDWQLDEGEVTILDSLNGDVVHSFRRLPGEVVAVRWSPDSKHIAATTYFPGRIDDIGGLFVWDVTSGETVIKLSSYGRYRTPLWSPDSKRLVFRGSPLCVLEITSEAKYDCLPDDTDRAWNIRWSPDSNQVAFSLEDGTMRVRDVTTGEEVRRFDGHPSGIEQLRWSSSGDQLVSVSEFGLIQLWDVTSGVELSRLEGHIRYFRGAGWSPDGKFLAANRYDYPMAIWDAASGEEVRRFGSNMDYSESAKWSPDGRYLLNGALRIWDVASGEEVHRLEGHTGRIASVSWSPDGSKIVSGSADNTVRIWDAVNGEEVYRLEGHTDWVTSAHWSPDGRQIASSSDDGTVRIWDVTTGEEVQQLNGYMDSSTSVSWSPDSRQIASRTNDRFVRIWDVASGEEVRSFESPTNRWIRSISWSLDGSQLASGISDGVITVWNVASGREARYLEGHRESIRNVSWAPDGRKIASSSDDDTVRVWDVMNGEEVHNFEGHTDTITSMSWSPDGRKIMSNSEDGTMRIWEVSNTPSDDDLTELTPDPSIRLTMVATVNDLDRDGMIERDETITYSFTVQNSGNVDLFNINVTQPRVTISRGPIAKLAPGEGDVNTFSSVYTLTQEDINHGLVTNSAVVSGVYGLTEWIEDTSDDPNNSDDIDTDGNGDPDDPTVVAIERIPGIALKKSGNFTDENGDGIAQAGETISYDFVVANTGNVLLTNVMVTDTLLTVTGAPVSLWTESSFSIPYTITTDDIAASDNIAVDGIRSEATARGTDPTGGIVEGYSDYPTYSPLLPAVYHPKRAEYVTDLIDLAPFEVERWGRGRITEIAYSPTGNQLAVATSIGVWLYRLDAPDNGRLLTHATQVNSVNWSPDELQVASGSNDGTVRIWDVVSGEEVTTLAGHMDQVNSVSWSPDGSYLASGSRDKMVRIWDVASGTEAHTIGQTSTVNSVGWSPDSSQVVVGSGELVDSNYNSLSIWDAASGEAVSYIEDPLWIKRVSWSPDGKYIAFSSPVSSVSIWDVASGEIVLTSGSRHVEGDVGVSWSPDSSQVVYIENRSAYILDVVSGTAMSHLEDYAEAVNNVNWSPDGRHIATASKVGTLQIKDAASGAEVSRLWGQLAPLSNASWSPDGSQVVLPSLGEGLAPMWDVASGERIGNLLPQTDYDNNISRAPSDLFPDSILTAEGGRNGIEIWTFYQTDNQTGFISTDGVPVLSVTWSPDASQIAASLEDSTVRVWDLIVTRGMTSATEESRFEGQWSVKWSPDGSKIVSGSRDNTVRIWDVVSGAEINRFTGHTDLVRSVSWSSDGSQVLSSSDDGTVRIWDVE